MMRSYDTIEQGLAAATHSLLIDGKSVPALSGKTFSVFNPATGQKLADVAEGAAEDIDCAVAAARRSFDDERWRGLASADRARVILRFADLIEANVDELSVVEVLNNGMPLAFAKRGIARGADWLRFYAGAIPRIHGTSLSSKVSQLDDFHAYSRKEPVGVAGLIIPWNGPILAFIIKVAPALAAGCTCVIKPSEITPLTALRLGELALEAGLPAGVLNVVPGYGADAGQRLAMHPDVDKISFTGSTAVGKELVKAAAGNLKRITLELGGKSPCIIFNDANMDIAIPGAAMAIAANSGQVCFAGSRLYVQRESYHAVVDGIGAFMDRLKIGSGLDPDTMLGPLVSRKQHQRVTDYIATGIAEGAGVIRNGGDISSEGYFVGPTIFSDVSPDMTIVKEEIFGPVLVAIPFDREDEIPALANATRYGLGAGVYTSNINVAHRLAAKIQSGNVWVNCYSMLDVSMPFGGYKESGWGREMSDEGLAQYLETKSVWVKLLP